jgi:hypothetical protein
MGPALTSDNRGYFGAMFKAAKSRLLQVAFPAFIFASQGS